jgi:hypothetical protein
MKPRNEGEQQPPLDTLRSLIDGARGLIGQLEANPLVARMLRVMEDLPPADREPIIRILEREATWCRIVDQTAVATGITVRPNPHASLYVQVLGPSEPLQRDVDVIAFGIDRFVSLVPLLFQEGVHEQWRASAYQLARGMDAEQRAGVARLAREVLSLLAEVDAERPVVGDADRASRAGSR